MRVRRPGTQRPAGKPVATIESGKWAGPVPNLFDCVIASANQQVLGTPALLNQYPYQAWIARVQPAAPVAQVLAALVTGERAHRDYFTMEGVKLAQKGVPEQLTAMKGGKTIIEFMRDAKAAGVKFHLCKPAMPGYEMEVTDVIAEIDEISNASALADLIISCDRTLVF